MKVLQGLKTGELGHNRPKKTSTGVKNFLGGGLPKKKKLLLGLKIVERQTRRRPKKTSYGVKNIREIQSGHGRRLRKLVLRYPKTKKTSGSGHGLQKKKLLLGLKKFEWRTLVEDTKKLRPG